MNIELDFDPPHGLYARAVQPASLEKREKLFILIPLGISVNNSIDCQNETINNVANLNYHDK